MGIKKNIHVWIYRYTPNNPHTRSTVFVRCLVRVLLENQVFHISRCLICGDERLLVDYGCFCFLDLQSRRPVGVYYTFVCHQETFVVDTARYLFRVGRVFFLFYLFFYSGCLQGGMTAREAFSSLLFPQPTSVE